MTYPLPENVVLWTSAIKGNQEIIFNDKGEEYIKPESKIVEENKIDDNLIRVRPHKKSKWMGIKDNAGKFVLPVDEYECISKNVNDFINLAKFFEGGIHREGFYFPKTKKTVWYNKVEDRSVKDLKARWVKDGDKYGFVDATGKEVTPIHFDKIGYRANGLISVEKDGKVGFIDKNGEVAIPFQFERDYTHHMIYNFRFDHSLAYLNGKYGFIDKKGKVVVPFEYEAISYFWQSEAIGYKNGKWEWIDL